MEDMKLKLVSINIEGRKHLKTVGDFLAQESLDVVCLMEVCQEDILKIAGNNYPFVVFAPNDVIGNIGGSQGLEPTGVAILSREVMVDVEKEYFGEKPRTQVVQPGSGTHAPVMLLATIGDMRIGAVHFTWTKKSSVSLLQMKHLDLLLKKLEKNELFLCGDFNIPRANEAYKKLAAHFKDNIPSEIVTTIDPIIHYANREKPGMLQTVVDYMWSTPEYRVENVRVVSGVSDHCAVVCSVEKT